MGRLDKGNILDWFPWSVTFQKWLFKFIMAFYYIDLYMQNMNRDGQAKTPIKI